MKIELNHHQRAVITTLLRREALALRAANGSSAEVSEQIGDILKIAETVEAIPPDKAPVEVEAGKGARDLKL